MDAADGSFLSPAATASLKARLELAWKSYRRHAGKDAEAITGHKRSADEAIEAAIEKTPATAVPVT